MYAEQNTFRRLVFMALSCVLLTSPASRTILGTDPRATFHLDSSSNAGNGAAAAASSCSSPPRVGLSLVGVTPRSLCLPPPRPATNASPVPAPAP